MHLSPPLVLSHPSLRLSPPRVPLDIAHRPLPPPRRSIEGTRIEAPEEGTPDLETLKIRYYEMLIRYHLDVDDYLEVCRCYRAIYDSESVQADADRWQRCLRLICWYLALSPAGVEHNTLLATTQADKRLGDLHASGALLRIFSTSEICSWEAFQAQFASEMEACPEVFAGAKAQKRMEDLRLRVIQHNILVVAKYYSRVTLPRLAQLLALSVDEAEKHLCDMAVRKALTVRIDRPKVGSGVLLLLFTPPSHSCHAHPLLFLSLRFSCQPSCPPLSFS